MTTFRQDLHLGTKVPLIKTDDYSDRSVTTEKIAKQAVTTDVLADKSVTTPKVTDYSITNSKLADDSVDERVLAEHSVTSSIIGNGAVETINLDEGAVTTPIIDNEAVTTEKIAKQAVAIVKIAQEVWDKLKDEYLRLDGKNLMKAALNMGDKEITCVKRITTESLSAEMRFNEDGCSFEFGRQDTDGSAPPVFMPMLSLEDQLVKAFGNVEAKGYQTTDQSSFGLLGNEGSVVLAMSDTDVDGVLHEVFNDNN